MAGHLHQGGAASGVAVAWLGHLQEEVADKWDR